MFRIGDFSRLSQVSIKALRFYDEVGLLKPTLVDGATGYRYYSANLLPRLNRILVFKELGFSLDEIALLLEGENPASQVQEMLRIKQAELKRNVDREQARLAQVETWLGKMEQDGRVPDYEIVLRQIAPQWVAARRHSIGSYERSSRTPHRTRPASEKVQCTWATRGRLAHLRRRGRDHRLRSAGVSEQARTRQQANRGLQTSGKRKRLSDSSGRR